MIKYYSSTSGSMTSINEHTDVKSVSIAIWQFDQTMMNKVTKRENDKGRP